MSAREGQMFPITDAWRDGVRSRLTELGWSQAELARQARVSPGAITDMLSGKIQQTNLMPDVHRALGWIDPFALFDPLVFEMITVLLDVPPHKRWDIIGQARNLKTGAAKKPR